MLRRAHRWMLAHWWASPLLAAVAVASAWVTSALDGQPYQFVLALAVSILAVVVWVTSAQIVWERWRFRRLQRRYAEAEDALIRMAMEEARRGASR